MIRNIIYILCAVFFISSCQEESLFNNEHLEGTVDTRSKCNEAEVTIVEGCCIVPEALPGFPGLTSFIDYGDNTIIQIDPSYGQIEHCYDESGTYQVVSTQYNANGDIVNQVCEIFVVRCNSCCDLVSYSFQQLDQYQFPSFCVYDLTIVNPSSCSFIITIDNFDFVLNANEEKEFLVFKILGESQNVSIESIDGKCTLNIEVPICGTCAGFEDVDVEFCKVEDANPGCCRMEFTMSNNSNQKVSLMKLENGADQFIRWLEPNEVYSRETIICDSQPQEVYYFANSPEGDLCQEFMLPRCSELDNCN